MRELLLEKADELGLVIEKMQIMPDHVHLFVKAQPTDAPHFIVGQLKAYTSFNLRNEFAELKSRLPHIMDSFILYGISGSHFGGKR